MAKGEQYEARVEAWITPVLEQHQFELVDVEYVREVGVWYLRCYIDKEGGITVDDCEMVSRRLSDWLDKEDFIDDSYILEVSSPGLGRPSEERERLCREVIGEAVEIQPVPRDRQTEGIFRDRSQSYDADSVTTHAARTVQRAYIRIETGIALIRLAFDF